MLLALYIKKKFRATFFSVRIRMKFVYYNLIRFQKMKECKSIALRDNLIILIFVVCSTCHFKKDKNETVTTAIVLCRVFLCDRLQAEFLIFEGVWRVLC